MTNELAGNASIRNYQRRIREEITATLPSIAPRHLVYASPQLHGPNPTARTYPRNSQHNNPQ